MNYICTHKDFEEYVTDGDYTIVSTTELMNTYHFPISIVDNDLKPLKQSYCEGYMIKDIYLNLYKQPDVRWIGINHYRRYFDKPKNETTLPIPISTNLRQNYAGCHNIQDWLQVEKIIDEYYPEYSVRDYNNINLLFPANMFIMKKSDFINYYNFVFGVLKIFSIQNNLYTDEDVMKHVQDNKNLYYNYDIDYQSRLHGFLMERLSTMFFLKQFKDKEVMLKPIITTT